MHPELQFLSSHHNSPFSESSLGVFQTVEHFYQSQKFAQTAPKFAKRIQQAPTAEEAQTLGHSRDYPIRNDWELVRAPIMRQAVELKFNSNPSLIDQLIDVPSSEIAEYLENNDLLCDVMIDLRKQYKQERKELKNAKLRISDYPSRSLEEYNPQPFRKRPNQNIYKASDGSSTFEMVSSSSVLVEDSGVTVPMNVIPAKAKTIAHQYQYQKKQLASVSVGSEYDVDLNEVDDDYEDDLDQQQNEYIYAPPPRKAVIEVQVEDSYDEQMATLASMGFSDPSANLSALITSQGDVGEAIDLLSM